MNDKMEREIIKTIGVPTVPLRNADNLLNQDSTLF